MENQSRLVWTYETIGSEDRALCCAFKWPWRNELSNLSNFWLSRDANLGYSAKLCKPVFIVSSYLSFSFMETGFSKS